VRCRTKIGFLDRIPDVHRPKGKIAKRRYKRGTGYTKSVS